MNRLKSSVPLVLSGLFVAILSGEIALVHREHTRAKKSCAALERKKQERDQLLRQVPAPTLENEQLIAESLSEAARTLTALRDELGRQRTGKSVPAGSVEAFFDLGRFVEEMRQRAADAHVIVGSTERFGFASYVSEGPDGRLLAAVHRQRMAAAVILAALFEARPLALLDVKRAPPEFSESEKLAVVAEDYFVLPPVLSLRQSGLVDVDAFRLEFTGQTGVLRRFANALAALPQPIVVRAVEAEAIKAAPPASVQSYQRPQVSKFAVMLEIPLIPSPGTSP